MFRECIRSDVVLVHILKQIKNMQFPEWWKKFFKLKET